MTRFTKQELCEIFAGEIAAIKDFAALHRKKGDRPEAWFSQQDRRLAAHQQILGWLKQAAERDRKEEMQQ
ncbi:hypothetical protein JYP46_01415 [Nitratireductor aquimarinus]|uniref:hypothetical protein n=1 Tax=Alphaproteobacteria TaxID=28211 RepID=UPI0019D35132|nr:MULTISPECIES: hypothetical protein [Alphaproteobacteria]MBN7755469.1 hypothetical protein [Nitratireductor aquimarinus]MBY5998224.1 hypothetical protein [Tritonibacter mobilis]MBY6020252.1 hypothetical protein [Nitratireductor sp. DP7N14-4]